MCEREARRTESYVYIRYVLQLSDLIQHVIPARMPTVYFLVI
jgi:hypothetical protein